MDSRTGFHPDAEALIRQDHAEMIRRQYGLLPGRTFDLNPPGLREAYLSGRVGGRIAAWYLARVRSDDLCVGLGEDGIE